MTMATASINLEIQSSTGEDSANIYISGDGGKGVEDQTIPVHSSVTMDGLEASLSTEEECLAQFVETFLIEVYRCTICRSCFTQKSAIQTHVKLHNFSRDIQNIVQRPPSVDSSLIVLPKTGIEVTHDRDGYHFSEKDKHSNKETSDKTCAAAAITNALEVLVGLGTPTLTEGESTEGKVSEGAFNQEKEYHGHVGIQNSEEKNNSTIYNLSEVSLRLQNPTKCLNQVSVKGEDSLVVLEACDNTTAEQNIADNVGIVLQQSKVPSASLDEHSDSPHAGLDVLSGHAPQATQLEDLPGSKHHTSVVLSHSSNQEGKDTVDIDGLVRSASESNPEASIITVVTHRGGDKPLEMLQFKKSCKSDAIIPTAQSLGIISPFPKQTRTSKRKHSCPKCQAKYVTEEELQNHIEKKHLRTNSFLCEICGIALATKATVKHHVLAKHSTGEVYRCDQCSYQTRFEKHFKNHVTKHTSKIWCQVCDQTFISTAKLKLHCQSPMHTNKVNPLVCPHCDYKTYKKDNLRVHMRKHTGQRPYQCIHCQYASADASTLKKHVMAKHSKIRPHRCQQCEFSSIDRKGLTIHMRKHTGERPFKCNQCDYAAKRQSALSIHMQTHDKVQIINLEVQPVGTPADSDAARSLGINANFMQSNTAQTNVI